MLKLYVNQSNNIQLTSKLHRYHIVFHLISINLLGKISTYITDRLLSTLYSFTLQNFSMRLYDCKASEKFKSNSRNRGTILYIKTIKVYLIGTGD